MLGILVRHPSSCGRSLDVSFLGLRNRPVDASQSSWPKNFASIGSGRVERVFKQTRSQTSRAALPEVVSFTASGFRAGLQRHATLGDPWRVKNYGRPHWLGRVAIGSFRRYLSSEWLSIAGLLTGRRSVCGFRYHDAGFAWPSHPENNPCLWGVAVIESSKMSFQLV